VAAYRAHGWDVPRAHLLAGVKQFLRGRFSKSQGCPNDGGRIPLVAEISFQGGAPVRYYWCRFCQELFAYLRDPHYGWRCVVSFRFDENRQAYLRTDNASFSKNVP
jgi:hypothetical protein